MVDMAARLRAMRKARGLTQRELAQRCGMADSAIRKYESGRQWPKVETLARLAYGLNTTVAELMEEEPEEGLWLPPEERGPRWAMLTAPQAPSAKDPLVMVVPYAPSPGAMSLARAFDKLDEDGQQGVRQALRAEQQRMLEAEAGGAPVAAKERRRRRVGPVEQLVVYEQAAAAGLGNYLDDAPRHTEQYLSEDVPRKTDFGVVIQGDSMEPLLHSGGTVFVRSTPVIEPGQIGIFVLNGEAYCKQLQVNRKSRKVRLVSLNPAYPDIVLGEADELRTLGQVLGQHTPGRPDEPFF